jgi:hypothetical protein
MNEFIIQSIIYSSSSWAYTCEQGGSGTDPDHFFVTEYNNINRPHGAIDAFCNLPNQALKRFSGSASIGGVDPFNSQSLVFESDRIYSYGCQEVPDVTLQNCGRSAVALRRDNNFRINTYQGLSTPRKILTGLYSPGRSGYRDGYREWFSYTCDIVCNEGFIEIGRIGCQAANCGILSLAHGTVSGSCSGAFNDVCKYEECDQGFQFAVSGTQERTCGILNNKAVWSGQPRICEGKYPQE